MVSKEQKRVWRYVEEGSLLKLKSYLRKHRELDVNFSLGKRERSPLHLACRLGDDASLRLLLNHGADVLRRDRRGDTALHVAAQKREWRAYEDLVIPLMKSCPEAMAAPNKAGLTPQDLLMVHTTTFARQSCPPERDLEKEWQEKLFGECEDEFHSTFGRYDDDCFLPVDDDEEDFGDWAERIRKEYYDKKHAEAQRMTAAFSKSKKSKEDREQEERRHQELHRRLQREHEEYQARAARKEEETRLSKKRKYDEGCAATFHAGSSSSSSAVTSKLSYSDIPWPAPRGTVQEMLDVMLHGEDRKDTTAFRKMLRKQQALWHPDKFAQRCGARLEEKDKQRILDTVTALSQELNRLAQSLRT